MPADNTAHLRAAARQRSDRTRQRALAALQRLEAAGDPINYEILAREAGVSRSWLYTQADLRVEIDRLRHRHKIAGPAPTTPQRQSASNESLLRRLQSATDRIRQIEHDNSQLRDALARAIGTARNAQIAPGPTRPGDTTPNSTTRSRPHHSGH